jgi:hypothetical protein
MSSDAGEPQVGEQLGAAVGRILDWTGARLCDVSRADARPPVEAEYAQVLRWYTRGWFRVADNDDGGPDSDAETARRDAEEHWREHRQMSIDENLGLPVPRLEIRCTPLAADWSERQWLYGMVYLHCEGGLVLIPLGRTRQCGGEGKPTTWAESQPWRESAHIRNDARQLGLLALMVVEDGGDVMVEQVL